MTHVDAPDTRPEPVMNPVKLGGLAGGATTAVGGAVVLISTGVTAEDVPALGLAVGGAVTAVAALVVYLLAVLAGRAAREQVTPLSDPMDALGNPLYADIPGQHAADRVR